MKGHSPPFAFFTCVFPFLFLIPLSPFLHPPLSLSPRLRSFPRSQAFLSSSLSVTDDDRPTLTTLSPTFLPHAFPCLDRCDFVFLLSFFVFFYLVLLLLFPSPDSIRLSSSDNEKPSLGGNDRKFHDDNCWRFSLSSGPEVDLKRG